jgi:hypothetical protein
MVATVDPRPGAPLEEQLAVEVRNRATRTGRCACGPTPTNVREVAPGVFSVTFRHEDDCPAISSAALRGLGIAS